MSTITTIRRWLTRILAFTAILSYGIIIVSSPKQLKNLLDAAFDVAAEENIHHADNHMGFRRTPYHKHIHTIPRGNNTNLNDTIARNNNRTSSVRISFELHDPKNVPLQNVFNLYVKCPLGKVTVGNRKKRPTGEFRKGELPPSLIRVDDERDYNGVTRSGRVLDFTITISTNLKLLLIGDSVMIQLAQAFDELVGGQALQTRKVVWEAWRGHDGGTVVAPTRGGGVSAMWRMTGLLSKSKKGKPPANSKGGGWSDKEIDAFFTYSYPEFIGDQQQQEQRNLTIGNFDVCVFRVMHGWMLVNEITHERLVEAVELSHELLGTTTVVLMTVPFTNNVKTVQEMRKVNEINDDIREIARSWHLRENTGGVRHVLVLEYGTYYNHIIWSNARHLGYNVSHPLRAAQHVFDTEGPGLVLDRLKGAGEWEPSIPMVCSDTASLEPHRRTCNRNYLFSDGMHTCPETLVSRYAAGLACLLGCVYNGIEMNNTSANEEENVRACERECNEQFLSVAPVDESWIDTNTTLASFSG
mmetsp:Transcript_12569/g.27271  ORF Transcript_12569/g.27271 Transcript_12569/m.27271 type:complete len:527 (-) Transcript_12569:419-1999(-)